MGIKLKSPFGSIIGAVIPIIIIIAVVVVAFKFQTDIGNFVSKLTRTKEEQDFDNAKRVEEKRVQENGIFDNIAEFFFGKPTEDKPATDDGVSKNDFDQNTATQQQRASKAQQFNDAQQQQNQEQQIAVDTRTQSTRDAQLKALIDQANANINKSNTVTVVKPKQTAVVVKPTTVKRPSSDFNKSAGGLVATLISSKSSSGSGFTVKKTTSGSNVASAGKSKGSSVGVSDRITATVTRGTATVAKQGTGNLSKQSQALNKKVTVSRTSRGK